MVELLDAYKLVEGAEAVEELLQLASILKGTKILHINSTKRGGGVAEILTAMTKITNALGIQTDWEVISGSPDFFQCTKCFHNALQGKQDLVFPPHFLHVYEQVNKDNAEKLRAKIEAADIVFIHDPQPVALINAFPERKNKWIWRCHIDSSNPKRKVWDYLHQFISLYDASIFSLKDFVKPLAHPMYIVPPSIDPLSEKNIELPTDEIRAIYPQFGIDPSRPILLQVSRFDHFKDPIGVIKAYRLTKKFKPDVQLILAGGGASDDPEGEQVLQEVRALANDDPDIHVLLLPEDANRTINALQRAADIVLQKSTKEGFGLTVAEALWKKKPVIGGNTGGIRLQVVNYTTGFLVNSPEGAALRMRYLLQNPHAIQEIGNNGQSFVRNNFLITRQVRDYLTLIIALTHSHIGRIELGKM